MNKTERQRTSDADNPRMISLCELRRTAEDMREAGNVETAQDYERAFDTIQELEREVQELHNGVTALEAEVYKSAIEIEDERGGDTMYKIIRYFFEGRNRVVKRGLTLSEAREHCSDSETSSSTCTGAIGKRRTRTSGNWFDGYEAEGDE